MKILRVYMENGTTPLVFQDVRRFIAGKTGIACWFYDDIVGSWGQVFFSHVKIAGFVLVNSEAPEPKEIKSYGPLREVGAGKPAADVDGSV